jgi:hypothetical protein
VLPVDPLLIPVWVIHGRKKHQRRAGVLMHWENRDGHWWGLVAERRGTERRLSWYAAGQLLPIR